MSTLLNLYCYFSFFVTFYMLGYTAVAVMAGIIYSMAGEARLFVSWHELAYRCYFQTETKSISVVILEHIMEHMIEDQSRTTNYNQLMPLEGNLVSESTFSLVCEEYILSPEMADDKFQHVGLE